MRPGLLSFCAYLTARVVGATLRLKVYGLEYLSTTEKGRIIAAWHGRSFVGAIAGRNRGWWVLASHSSDGEIIARAFQRFGFGVVRGSTQRGGARAALECARLLRKGKTFVYSPDGPRGPSQIVQPGMLWIAQQSGARIIPASASSRPRKIFSSWDKYMLPLPFAKAAIVFRQPIEVPKGLDSCQLETLRKKLEHEINLAQEEADRLVGN